MRGSLRTENTIALEIECLCPQMTNCYGPRWLMYQVRGPYYDESNLFSFLQIEHDRQVGLTTTLPPCPSRHTDFGFWADLDSASKVGKTPYAPHQAQGICFVSSSPGAPRFLRCYTICFFLTNFYPHLFNQNWRTTVKAFRRSCW